jgi:hypothetical protein
VRYAPRWPHRRPAVGALRHRRGRRSREEGGGRSRGGGRGRQTSVVAAVVSSACRRGCRCHRAWAAISPPPTNTPAGAHLRRSRSARERDREGGTPRRPVSPPLQCRIQRDRDDERRGPQQSWGATTVSAPVPTAAGIDRRGRGPGPPRTSPPPFPSGQPLPDSTGREEGEREWDRRRGTGGRGC